MGLLISRVKQYCNVWKVINSRSWWKETLVHSECYTIQPSLLDDFDSPECRWSYCSNYRRFSANRFVKELINGILGMQFTFPLHCTLKITPTNSSVEVNQAGQAVGPVVSLRESAVSPCKWEYLLLHTILREYV